MCGIAGIFRRRGLGGSDPRRLRAMTDTILHRGPDDYGYLLLNSRDGSYTLGHEASLDRRCDVLLGSRRLSIIDTTPAGRQPMTNEEHDAFVVFNGEIYNYLELRRDLQAQGHRFSSNSDTEVIVHAYEEWGPSCVSRFNGMWAFALWDQRRHRLFCSRDRFGVKPFYYFLSDDVFVFASEIKAVLAGLPRPAAPNWGPIYDFLTRNTLCHTEETVFGDIRRLPAAHSLLLSYDASAMAPYWRYDSQTEDYDYGRPVETFARLLDDAVRLRLHSDVPVGIALSGGMDSSSITALASRHVGRGALKVFTAEFPGTRHDERRHAELVARRFGAEFHVARYRPKSLTEDLRRVTWHMDHPASSGQILARWELMEVAARQVKVILEGQGSDEMLAGYPDGYFSPWFRDELQGLRPRNVLRASRRLTAAVIERYRRSGWNPMGAVAARLFPRLRRDHRLFAASERALTPAFRELGRQSAGRPADRPRDGAQLTRALLNDHRQYILPRLLMFGDAISMGQSLESRLPFLDYRLVEFVFGLPARWKFDGIESKIILRRALKDVLPPDILARKDKIGFGTPINQWIGDCLDSEVRPLLLSSRARSRGIFDHAEIEKTLARFRGGDTAIARLIFSWMSIEIWLQVFIDGEGITAHYP